MRNPMSPSETPAGTAGPRSTRVENTHRRRVRRRSFVVAAVVALGLIALGASLVLQPDAPAPIAPSRSATRTAPPLAEGVADPDRAAQAQAARKIEETTAAAADATADAAAEADRIAAEQATTLESAADAEAAAAQADAADPSHPSPPAQSQRGSRDKK